MEFSIGDDVIARLPGSRRMHKAQVIAINDDGYDVLFQDGTKLTLGQSFLMYQKSLRRSTSRSRATQKSRSPDQMSKRKSSPSRAKSSERTRVGRPRVASDASMLPSPSRRKSPARQISVTPRPSSVSVTLRQSSVSVTPRQSSVSVTPRQISVSVKEAGVTLSGSMHSEVHVKDEISLPPTEEKSFKSLVSEETDDKEGSGMLHLGKLIHLERSMQPVVEVGPFQHIVSSSASTFTHRTSTHFATIEDGSQSEGELEILKKTEHTSEPSEKYSHPERSHLHLPIEFGGWMGALLLIILMPCSILGVHVYSAWVVKGLAIPTDWNNYLDLNVVVLYMLFFGMQVLLSLMPFGKIIEGLPNKLGRFYYRCNGFWACIFTVTSVGVVHLYCYPVTVISEKYIQLLITAIMVHIGIAIYLFIRGGHVPISTLNPYGTTDNFIYDFWMGREVSPRLGKLDIKTALLKNSLITSVVLYEVLVIQSLDVGKDWNLALLFTLTLQIFYAVQCLWHEQMVPTTFFVLYEGCGYMFTVGCSLYPFINIVLPMYLMENRMDFSLWYAVPILLLMMIGYHMYIASNYQKFQFRTCPLYCTSQPVIIPTLRGKKLLASGWWGFVRHPNYLGDILMHWTWIGTCDLTHWLPLFPPALTTVLLLHRAIRDDTRCQLRYGDSWKTYCKSVKSRVIPKLF